MSKKEIVSTNQIIWMLFILITSFTTLQILALLIFHSGRDAWLSVLLAWFLDVMLAIVYAYMGLRFPGQNMMQYSITILGKYFGRLIGFITSLFFLMTAALLMKSISMLLSNLILPNTPMIVIMITGYIIAVYALEKGVEVIARVCEILGPVYLISLILLLAAVSPEVNMDRLQPQLIDGPYPFISGSIFILSFIGICIMMGMFQPICNHPENSFLSKFIPVSMGAVVISVLVTFSIGTFGVKQAGNMVNIGTLLMRRIALGDVLQRVEIIWIIIAIGAGIMTTSIMIWASSTGISQIAGLNSYRNIAVPLAFLAFTLNINMSDSNVDILNFIFYSYPFIGMFVETGLEVFLFIMAIILRKRGPST